MSKKDPDSGVIHDYSITQFVLTDTEITFPMDSVHVPRLATINEQKEKASPAHKTPPTECLQVWWHPASFLMSTLLDS